jgi:molybdate transport system substrate-binding protein
MIHGPRGGAAIVGFALLLGQSPAAHGMEARIIVATPMKAAITELAAQFERATGNRIVVESAAAPAIKKMIDGGAKFDAIILASELFKELSGRGKIDPVTATPVARVGIGIAIRAGAPRPDLGSIDALKNSLKAANGIGFTDPASGSAGGVNAAAAIDRLGMTAELKSRIKVYPPGSFPRPLVQGEVDLWLTQTSEIVQSAGVSVGGVLPSELQNYTIYVAGVMIGAKDTKIARGLIGHFAALSAVEALKAMGMEPAAR